MTNESDNINKGTSDQIDKWRFGFSHLDITSIRSEEDLDISKIQSAIVIIHASWSGPSIIHILKILDTLNSVQTKEKIYIVDIDSVSGLFIKNIFKRNIHGCGEAVHIFQGKVVAKYLFQQTFEPFLKYITKNLKG